MYIIYICICVYICIYMYASIYIDHCLLSKCMSCHKANMGVSALYYAHDYYILCPSCFCEI